MPWAERVEALGTLKANESVNITANVTETISAIHFDDGQRVSEGDILVELTSVEQHALLEEAAVRAGEAERQYQRVKALVAQGAASESLLDERKRDLDTARAVLVAIESRLSDRLIKAPFDGVLGLRNVSRGTLVEPADTITTLDDDSFMKLDFTVPSVYMSALQPGLRIEARAPAYGDRTFEGVVRGVDSRVDPVTRSIQVRALIPNPERTLKPGLLMRVELLVDPRDAPGRAGGRDSPPRPGSLRSGRGAGRRWFDLGAPSSPDRRTQARPGRGARRTRGRRSRHRARPSQGSAGAACRDR
jgi:membrane fusion protein, multidrug efflux system